MTSELRGLIEVFRRGGFAGCLSPVIGSGPLMLYYITQITLEKLFLSNNRFMVVRDQIHKEHRHTIEYRNQD